MEAYQNGLILDSPLSERDVECDWPPATSRIYHAIGPLYEVLYLSIYFSVCHSVCVLYVHPPTHTSPYSFSFILSFFLSPLLPILDLQSFSERKRELYADAVHAVQSSRIRGRHSHILVQVRYNFLCTLFPVLICILRAAGLFQWGSASSPASRCSIERIHAIN